MRYPDPPESLLRLEEELLETWREEDLFRKTLEKTASGVPFVFYEGPPTANGRPGLHHIISRTLKDLVCRHQTMKGRSVTRIAGWDTHGLPVEIEAEKKLGISGKPEIEALGIEIGLGIEPGAPPARYVRPVLFGGVRRLFLRVTPRRLKKSCTTLGGGR